MASLDFRRDVGRFAALYAMGKSLAACRINRHRVRGLSPTDGVCLALVGVVYGLLNRMQPRTSKRDSARLVISRVCCLIKRPPLVSHVPSLSLHPVGSHAA